MLLIDYHEPIAIIEKLKSSLKVEVLKLKYGDYSFSDVVIERKTLSDFFLSLKNNRLADEMESINRYYTENKEFSDREDRASFQAGPHRTEGTYPLFRTYWRDFIFMLACTGHVQ